jgi:hypothetical protein
MIVRLLFAIFLSLSLNTGLFAQTFKTAVFDECPSKQPIGKPQIAPIIAAALIPALVTQVVNVASTALTKAAEPKTETFWSTPTQANFYLITDEGHLQPSLSKKCLVVIGENLEPRGKAVPDWASKWHIRLNAYLRNTKAGTDLKSLPALYFEATIEFPAPSGTAFVLTPQFFYVDDYLKSRWGASSHRDYVLNVSLSAISDGKTFANASFTLPGIKEGLTYGACDPVVDGPHCPPVDRFGFKEPRSPYLPVYPKNDALSELVNSQKATISLFQQIEGIANRKAPLPVRAREDLNAQVLKSRTEYCAELAAARKAAGVAKDRFDSVCPPALTEKGAKVTDAVEAAKTGIDAAWIEKVGPILCADWAQWKGANPKSKLSCRPGQSPADKKSFEVLSYPYPEAMNAGATEISVVVTETTNASQWLQILAKAVDSSKGQIATAISDQLNKPAQEAKARADAEVDQDNKDAARLAMLDVSIAQNKLDEATASTASERAVLEKSLLTAKQLANKAARKAGQATPYPEIQ